jgi:hypothetical protein
LTSLAARADHEGARLFRVFLQQKIALKLLNRWNVPGGLLVVLVLCSPAAPAAEAGTLCAAAAKIDIAPPWLSTTAPAPR